MLSEILILSYFTAELGREKSIIDGELKNVFCIRFANVVVSYSNLQGEIRCLMHENHNQCPNPKFYN